MPLGNTARFVTIDAFSYDHVIDSPRNLIHLHVQTFIGVHILTRRSASIKDKMD